MTLPDMYHFTHVGAAANAAREGLLRRTTPNDPLQKPGVWLSPNEYATGVGSVFGPIGLRVAESHLAACECIPIAPNPQHRGRHRFLLVPKGVKPPSGVARRATPPKLPNAMTPCELLLLDDVPATEIAGVVFGEQIGIRPDESQREHVQMLAHLLAEQHRLVGALLFPHSTEERLYGGWWTFRRLRKLLVAAARGDASATTSVMRAVLSRVGTDCLTGREGLSDLNAQSVWEWVTDEYAATYQAAGVALDLTGDAASSTAEQEPRPMDVDEGR